MTLPSGPTAAPPFLYMTDPERRPDALADAAQLACRQGVILRHYGHPDRTALALQLARLCRAPRAVLLVGADWRLAARVGAAGVHLPQHQLRAGLLAPLLGWARRGRRWVTAACHDAKAVRRAHRLGLSAVLISPVHVTQSHPHAKTLGLLGFARLVRLTNRPAYALGGMTRVRARATDGRGGRGWASVRIESGP